MAQKRHHMAERDHLIEVGSAQTDAVAGQDADPSFLGAEHREVRRAATDIDDQTDRPGPPET